MGTNIIDAFVVTFGLDSRGFKSGSRDVRKDFRDIKDEAEDSFGEVEKRGKDSALALRGLASEAAGLFLILAGANSLKALASDMLTGAASASRFGETIGMSAGRVTGWQVAIEKVGGSAEDANTALQRMMDIAYKYKFGQGAEPGLQALGIDVNDLNKADPEAMLMKLAAARSRFSPQDYARRLQMLGLPQSTIYLLEQGTDAVRKQVDQAEKHANITKKDEDAAKNLQSTLVDLSNDIKGQLRPELTRLVDKLDGFLKDMDSLNAGLPLLAAGVAGIAGAAILAYGPWALLAGAIGLAVIAYRDWQRLEHATTEQKQAFDEYGTKIRKQFLGHLLSGDVGGAINDIGTSFSDRVAGRDLVPGYNPGGGTSGSVGGAAGGTTPGGVAGSYIGSMMGGGAGGPTIGNLTPLATSAYNWLVGKGVAKNTAMGIAAGIQAEGGGLGMAANGAFGIGQWRGGRRDALRRQFGKAPTFEQQMQFLLAELRGGDPGGSTVLGQPSAEGAMRTYLQFFMRPQGKNNEHWADLVGDWRRGYSALGMRAPSNVSIGTIVVNTRATDAKGIARDIGGALRDRSLNSQAAVGLTP